MTVPDWGRNLRRPLLDVAVLVGASAFLPLALDHAGWFPGGAMPGASAVSKALRVVSLALLVACAMPIDPRRWRFAEFACLLALVAGFLVVNRCFDYFSGGAVIALLLADACRAGAAVSAAAPARP